MAASISRSYRRDTQDVFAPFALNITERMLQEPKFAHLKTTVGELRTKFDVFILAKSAALNRSSDNIRARNSTHKDMVDLADSLAEDIEKIPAVDEDLILLSGFVPLTKKPKSAARSILFFIAAPTILKVVDIDGQSGVAQIFWGKIEGSAMYQIRFLPKGEIIWQGDIFQSTLNIVITDLPSNVYVEFQMRTITKNNVKSDWSASKGAWIS